MGTREAEIELHPKSALAVDELHYSTVFPPRTLVAVDPTWVAGVPSHRPTTQHKNWLVQTAEGGRRWPALKGRKQAAA